MKFEGSYVALVTPFDAAGRLDEDAYRALVRRQIKAGTKGSSPAAPREKRRLCPTRNTDERSRSPSRNHAETCP